MPYRRVTKTVAQNIPWVPGANMRDIAIPTDHLIGKINIILKGTPGGTTTAPGSAQNAFWPAVANVLGSITLEGTPLDGSKGVNIRNIPAGALWFRNWMMKAVQPEVTDLTPANLQTAVYLDMPLAFLDERLPEGQQILTALDARRYAGNGQSSLNLKIQTGNLSAANGSVVDKVGIVGGTYAGTAGTLTISVTVEQIQMIAPGARFPNYNEGGALGMLDLDLEYIPMAGLAQNASNGLVLLGRGLQAETFFFDADRDANQLETPVNNLGVTPGQTLDEFLGTALGNNFDPNGLRSNDLALYLASALAFPAGVYAVNDWNNNLQRAYHLLSTSDTHSWSLNMGATSLVDSLMRVLHVTYNPSTVAKVLGKITGR